MKTNSIVSLVFLLFTSIMAKSQTPAINFWTPETVVLYRGIENPLAVNLCGNEIEDLQINASDGAQIINNEGKISVFVPVDFENDNLYIQSVLKKDNSTSSTTMLFKVRDIPIPVVSLGNLGSVKRSFTKEEILSNLSFTIVPPDYFPYEVSYKIISYEFLIITNGVTSAITAKGGEIKEQFAELIKNANEPVHRIIFADITLEGPGGKTVITGLPIEIFNGWEE